MGRWLVGTHAHQSDTSTGATRRMMEVAFLTGVWCMQVVLLTGSSLHRRQLAPSGVYDIYS